MYSMYIVQLYKDKKNILKTSQLGESYKFESKYTLCTIFAWYSTVSFFLLKKIFSESIHRDSWITVNYLLKTTFI